MKNETSAISGLSVQESVLQALLLTVHSAEAQLGAMSNVRTADNTKDSVIEKRREALECGSSDLVSLANMALTSGLGAADTAPSENVVNVSLSVPERVLPQHQFLTNFGGSEEDLKNASPTLADDAIKTLSTLSFLCDEVHQLQDLSGTLITGVLMFGPRPGSSIAEGDEASQRRADELLLCMGNSLPFFQELHNFTLRCERVARNILCQISGCLSDHLFCSVRVLPLAESLCSLLGILISVDSSISGNHHLADAWRLYKLLVREASVANSAEESPNDDFSNFEKMIVELDQHVMTARCVVIVLPARLFVEVLRLVLTF